MEYQKLSLEGACLLVPKLFGDSRGYFMETFRADEFRREVADVTFIQDNESLSGRGVVRGLHYQAGEKSQAKLVRVADGCVLDVIVDLRHGSPTFGQHLAVELSGENHRQLYVPRGFAHGFAVLSETARFIYKVDNYYAPEAERTLLLNDPALGIEWPFSDSEMIVSEKDRCGVPFDSLTDIF